MAQTRLKSTSGLGFSDSTVQIIIITIIIRTLTSLKQNIASKTRFILKYIVTKKITKSICTPSFEEIA